MTHADFPTERPMPDPADLRLLAELINNVSIPLANAAWNAQMSQAEAALRLVSMAERGMPLRLVADGDRTALWHIAQAGPVAPPPPSGPYSAPPGPYSTSSGPYPAAPSGPSAAPAAPSGPSGAPPPPPAAPAVSSGVTAAAVSSGVTAPAAQESVPLGDPPFGNGDPDRHSPAAPVPSAASGTPSSTSGAPWQRHTVTGPDGEQLAVTLLEVADPADAMLAGQVAVGAGQRAVLVRSRVENTGHVGYAAPGDLYLVLETDQQTLLGRTAAALTSHPGFAPGVAAGSTVDGWSLFLIPQDTTLAGVKWCIRPDIPQSILSWPIAP